MKLTEIAKNTPGFVIDQATKEFVGRYGSDSDRWWMTDQGIVYQGSWEMNDNNELQKLPVKFHNVRDSFQVYNTALTTLEGAPKHAGQFSVEHCAKITNDSIQHFPTACEILSLHHNGFTSLSGIHKHVKICQEIYTNVTAGLLGLLYINNLRTIHFNSEDIDLKTLMVELNTQFKKGAIDIHIAQERLIEAGFPQAARL